jgi:hypothetical protein
VTLDDARRLALALPEASESPHFDCTSFRVRNRIFATAPPDGAALHVFVGEDVRAPALALHGAFVDKLTWGGKVVGLRVDLAGAKADTVRKLLRRAWEGKAPKTLVAKHPAS